jgi:putative ABC transport system permease protein
MPTFFNDFRYALRSLVKRPGFTVVATLTLALGIGANTTVFTFLNAVLFEPIPFHDTERTVFIWSIDAQAHNDRSSVSTADFRDWRTQAQSFDELAAYSSDTLTLTGDGPPERIRATYVTANFFPLMDVTPEIGRGLLPAEEHQADSHSALLSYSFWQQRFDGDPDIVGRTVTLNSTIYTIAGVMPRKVWFPQVDTKVWLPLALDSDVSRASRFLVVFGNLKKGVRLDQARSEMEVISQRLASTYVDTNTGFAANVLPLDQAILKDTDRAVMRLLIATVMLVLLITCANTSNLLLSRGAGRQREIAVRVALGATRTRLIRQLLTESIVLALGGGVVGLLIAFWGADALMAVIPHRAPPPETLVNGFIFGVTLLVALVSAVVFGLAPAFEISKSDVNSTLKEAGRGSGSIRGKKFRSALIVAEVTMTLVLLIGGGLVIRQAIHFQNLDPGFQTQGLLSVQVDLSGDEYKGDFAVENFYSKAIEKLAALPGVQSVAAASQVPITSDGDATRFVLAGGEGAPVPERPTGTQMRVSAGFFRTLGIPIVKGRSFGDQDAANTPPVAVVNEEMVRKFLGTRDPIGQPIALSGANGLSKWMTIIGVTKDLMPANLRAGKQATIYVLNSQFPDPSMILVLRTSADPRTLGDAARLAIWSIDRNLPIDKAATVQELINEDFRGGLALSYLFGVFGAVALTLATIGIYGVISYSASQRTLEIGIRMALGASRRDVLGMVIGQGFRMVAIGILAGLGGGFALTRILARARALVGVSPNDPVTFVSATAIVLGTALAATYLPARRAMRIDPINALRHE